MTIRRLHFRRRVATFWSALVASTTLGPPPCVPSIATCRALGQTGRTRLAGKATSIAAGHAQQTLVFLREECSKMKARSASAR